jgi:DNA-binding transcriptional regulator YiaG
MGKKYESEILMVCHQEAENLYQIGAIDAERMQEFDEMCLAHDYEPEPVEELVPSY